MRGCGESIGGGTVPYDNYLAAAEVLQQRTHGVAVSRQGDDEAVQLLTEFCFRAATPRLFVSPFAPAAERGARQKWQDRLER